MSNNTKKQRRRLELLRSRAEFLGITGAIHLSMKDASQCISGIIGYHKFMTYIISAKRLEAWEKFKAVKAKKSKFHKQLFKDHSLRKPDRPRRHPNEEEAMEFAHG